MADADYADYIDRLRNAINLGTVNGRVAFAGSDQSLNVAASDFLNHPLLGAGQILQRFDRVVIGVSQFPIG